ncbi:hypothetical protein HDU76_010959, partial [Blyttiomyces sp. JEL0837]
MDMNIKSRRNSQHFLTQPAYPSPNPIFNFAGASTAPPTMHMIYSDLSLLESMSTYPPSTPASDLYIMTPATPFAILQNYHSFDGVHPFEPSTPSYVYTDLSSPTFFEFNQLTDDVNYNNFISAVNSPDVAGFENNGPLNPFLNAVISAPVNAAHDPESQYENNTILYFTQQPYHFVNYFEKQYQNSQSLNNTMPSASFTLEQQIENELNHLLFSDSFLGININNRQQQLQPVPSPDTTSNNSQAEKSSPTSTPPPTKSRPPPRAPGIHACPYPLCNKTYATRRRLNAHKRIHNRERIFDCPEPSCD